MKPDSNILISRKLRDDSPLRAWCSKNGCRLTEKPFIKLEGIPDLEIPVTRWVFLSSPTALELYLKYYKIKAEKIAVFGEGTNRKLKEFGLTANYVGDASLTSKEIGIDFFNRIQGQDVFFPISQRSLRNISSQGSMAQVIEQVTYHTLLNEEKLTDIPDTIIFTSPSNVEGYLLKNEIANSDLIAFGEATAGYLKNLNAEKVLIPKSPDENSIIDLLESL